jgi:hypothetical protein
VNFPRLFFLFSKRSHGQTDLAPRKALKVSVCAASAAPGLVVQPTLSQGVSPQGAPASPASGEQAPEAGSSAEAAIVIGETERELGLHLVPKYFWWLNCPTQIFGLTSLPKCIDYTGVQGSHSANKKTKFWIQ